MYKIIFSLIFSCLLTACGPGLEFLADIHKPNYRLHDEWICEHGEPSQPGEPTRAGCVNNKSELDNKDSYYNYKKERDLYLEDQKK